MNEIRQGVAPGNGLLAALDHEERARLSGALERVRFGVGDVLCESGQPLAAAFFPDTGVVALSCVMANGATIAVALVGAEGVVGISLFMSGAGALVRAVVVAPGDGLRLHVDHIRREAARGGQLQAQALRYLQALTTQVAQTAVCNRHHSVCQQLCRWLLLAFDRIAGVDLRMTHEQLAHLLGVRREGVTEAAVKLQEAGLIRYSRGLIHLRDRAGLEARACECHGVVLREYDRLLAPADGMP
jgi:CRP-like cAMP-binding protein